MQDLVVLGETESTPTQPAAATPIEDTQSLSNGSSLDKGVGSAARLMKKGNVLGVIDGDVHLDNVIEVFSFILYKPTIKR